nr:tRNA (adenosine(37)-N6)-threonylcarbamoyltransferase complex transferase subunit TsaD [Lyticum sinuosum]
MTILGIETSCDETAAAIVQSNRKILSHIVHSQNHQEYGGVVPEIAARDHMAKLPEIINNTLIKSGLNSWNNIDAIAVTTGPGLVGGLITGIMVAKGIASGLSIPCIPVNHLVGHALTPRLIKNISFPYLLLLVSGGHCIIAVVYSALKYHILGQTLDDAAGEAFDKVAKMLGLNYPGGPSVEKAALTGDTKSYNLPEPFANTDHCNFSFSGLKTAVNRIIIKNTNNINKKFISDICASFQSTVAKIIVGRLKNAIFLTKKIPIQSLVVSGGVAANKYIRDEIQNLAYKYNLELHIPPLSLCTDNGAMIAWAGIEMIYSDINYHEKNINNIIELYKNYDFAPRSRWPLDLIF